MSKVQKLRVQRIWVFTTGNCVWAERESCRNDAFSWDNIAWCVLKQHAVPYIFCADKRHCELARCEHTCPTTQMTACNTLQFNFDESWQQCVHTFSRRFRLSGRSTWMLLFTYLWHDVTIKVLGKITTSHVHCEFCQIDSIRYKSMNQCLQLDSKADIVEHVYTDDGAF